MTRYLRKLCDVYAWYLWVPPNLLLYLNICIKVLQICWAFDLTLIWSMPVWELVRDHYTVNTWRTLINVNAVWAYSLDQWFWVKFLAWKIVLIEVGQHSWTLIIVGQGWSQSLDLWINIKGAIIFYQEGGLSVCGGGGPRIFWGGQRGDQYFFSGPKGETRISWGSKRGDQNFFSIISS